jgi:hypothetical protein
MCVSSARLRARKCPERGKLRECQPIPIAGEGGTRGGADVLDPGTMTPACNGRQAVLGYRRVLPDGRYGNGSGAMGLPAWIDEQFCGAGRSAKRSLTQAIEFGSHGTRLQTWLSASYCS